LYWNGGFDCGNIGYPAGNLVREEEGFLQVRFIGGGMLSRS
jgi:hypothetical protein